MLYLVYVCIILYILNWLLRRLKIGNYSDRYVLITGCDSGFGNLLAKRLDGMGFRVFACCLTQRGITELQAECSDNLVAMELDVTNETSIEKSVEQVKRKLPKNKGLWAVVNNAGVVGSMGPSSWQTKKDYDDTLAVNFFGVIFVTKAFLPLVIQERGRVVNMSSVMARFPISATPYTVSKYGVEGFSDVLRRELYLHKWGSVHIIEPGFFNTSLVDTVALKASTKAKLDSLPADIKMHTPEAVFQKIFKGIDMVKSKLESKDTYKVVDAYVHAITATFPRARYLVGYDANIAFRILWNLPEWLSDFIVIRIMFR